jgi:tetratricopeptide (TPR) repeat protein
VANTYKHLNVFIGSPGDVLEERALFRDIINEVNTNKANDLGYHIEAVGWEDTMPGKGRPQVLINKDVESADLAVFVLGKRWGSPTDEKGKKLQETGKPFISGMEEEFNLVNSLNDQNGKPEIFLYFKAINSDMMADAGPQLRQVIDFRKKIELSKQFLYIHYDNIEQWRKEISKHLSQWLERYKKNEETGSIENLPVINDDLANISTEMTNELREMSAALADVAVEKSNNGSITAAEELFAKATSSKVSDTYAITLYGHFLKRIGQLDRALKKYQEVLNIGEVSNDRELIAISFGNMGIVYQTQGELDKALEMYEKSLNISKEQSRKEGMANQYGNIGEIFRIQGALDKALEMFKKSLEISEEIDLKETSANQYGNLGIVYKIQGELKKALEMYDKGLLINKELGNKEGIAAKYGNMGNVFRIQGKLDKALEMYDKSLEINQELGRKEGIAIQYGNLGIISEIRKEFDKAKEYWIKSRNLWEYIGNQNKVEKSQGFIDDLPKSSEDNSV